MAKFKEPAKTVKAYKLFRVDQRQPGKLFPLFVHANQPVDLDTWHEAQIGEMTGDKVKSKIGPLAFRPGWHAGDLPVATHIGEKSDPKLTAPDTRPANHVWAEVEMPDDVDWQSVANERGTNAQGRVVPVKAHITDQIPVGGHYRYKTNSNMTGNWLIGGAMKVNKVLSDKEVRAINKAAGVADLPRAVPFPAKKYGFAKGGSASMLVIPDHIKNEELANYRDPKTSKIADWKWRKMSDVRKDVPITEIPDYIQGGYGEFMKEQQARAKAGQLSPRDLLKAFTITQSSIGRGGLSHASATKTGMKLPNTGGEVRPEGAFAEWLGSPMGQKYLNAAEQGLIDPAALSDIQQKFSPFGKHNQLIDQMAYAAHTMPGMAQGMNQAVTGSTEDYRDWAEKMKGIAGAKSGFVGSMLGRGDLPTLDARQLNLHALPAKVGVGSIMARGKGTGAREAVDRLAARQQAMNLRIDPSMAPHYQHLAHHAVWDAMGKNQTTHDDLMRAMRGYADGGSVISSIVNTFPSLAPLASAFGYEKPTEAPAYNPLSAFPADTLPSSMPETVKFYRADPTGKFGGKEGLETLPAKFSAGKVDDPSTLYRYARMAGAANKYGYPTMSPEEVAAFAIKEGRADLGHNDMTLGNKQEKDFDKKLDTLHDIPIHDKNFLTTLMAKKSTADRFGVSLPEAWNGLGVSSAGQSGRDYARNWEAQKAAALHPKNKEFMNFVRNAYEEGRKYGLIPNKNTQASAGQAPYKHGGIAHIADGGSVENYEQPETNSTPASLPVSNYEKMQLFTWLQKAHPELMTYNNNEPAAFLAELALKSGKGYSDKNPVEQPWQRKRVNPFTDQQDFHDLPTEDIYGQRREMPKHEHSKLPNMPKGMDYRREIQELQDSINSREGRLGMPYSGGYYARGGKVTHAHHLQIEERPL